MTRLSSSDTGSKLRNGGRRPPTGLTSQLGVEGSWHPRTGTAGTSLLAWNPAPSHPRVLIAPMEGGLPLGGSEDPLVGGTELSCRWEARVWVPRLAAELGNGGAGPRKALLT